jgi:hypothetical protein
MKFNHVTDTIAISIDGGMTPPPFFGMVTVLRLDRYEKADYR